MIHLQNIQLLTDLKGLIFILSVFSTVGTYFFLSTTHYVSLWAPVRLSNNLVGIGNNIHNRTQIDRFTHCKYSRSSQTGALPNRGSTS